jgi:hypothetical protein
MGALIAGLLLLTAGTVTAQNVGGSIGVSLTILQPVTTQAVQIVGFNVDRTGMATVETTSPVTGAATQLVMTNVSSSSSRFVPQQQASSLVRGEQQQRTPARISYQVNVGKHVHGVDREPVQLLVQYLAVAGT